MKKKLIVYDFDKTIYGGESGTNFFTYYLRNYPLKGLLFGLTYLKEVLFYLIKITDLKRLKERFFIFLESHSSEEIEKIVDGFWKKYEKKMYSWTQEELQENKKEADMVIVTSATPLFLLERLIPEMGYDMVFGTEFKGDGEEKFVAEIKGENNKGMEKVRKLDKWAKENNIELSRAESLAVITEKISASGHDEILQELRDKRRDVIYDTQNNKNDLMTWLYANQGEMRFGAENRLFVVLIDSSDMSQSWKMKRAFEQIEPTVNDYLNNFTNELLSRIDFAFKGSEYSSLADVIFVVR